MPSLSVGSGGAYSRSDDTLAEIEGTGLHGSNSYCEGGAPAAGCSRRSEPSPCRYQRCSTARANGQAGSSRHAPPWSSRPDAIRRPLPPPITKIRTGGASCQPDARSFKK